MTTKKIKFSVAAAVLSLVTTAAEAKIYYATPATIKSIWAVAVGGDTIRMSGRYGALELANKYSTVPITIDARSAVFTNAFVLRNDVGVHVYKGKFDLSGGPSRLNKAVAVYGGSDITFDKPTVIGGIRQVGLFFAGATDIAVTNGSFTNLWASIQTRFVTDGLISKNKIVGAGSDGMDVVASHNVTVDHNVCSGGNPQAGVHPDCLQLYSLKGYAPQSDITISYNAAYGPTQGFTSFNPADGGGIRITMTHNRVDTTYPQGIACYGCFDSSFTYNVLSTRPGARYMTNINIIGGSGNVIANNVIGAKPAEQVVLSVARPLGVARFAAVPAFSRLQALPDDAGIDTVGTVPEPATWAMLIAGFGFVGMAMRRRRPVVCA